VLPNAVARFFVICVLKYDSVKGFYNFVPYTLKRMKLFLV